MIQTQDKRYRSFKKLVRVGDVGYEEQFGMVKITCSHSLLDKNTTMRLKDCGGMMKCYICGMSVYLKGSSESESVEQKEII